MDLAALQTTLIQFFNELIDHMSAWQVPELLLMRAYFQYAKPTELLQTIGQSLHDHAASIRARDTDFFLHNQELREWLGQYSTPARIDTLIDQVWTTADDDFKASIWMWVDTMCHAVAVPVDEV